MNNRFSIEPTVIISQADYDYYRQLEDQFDGELALQRLAETDRRYSSEEIKAELGLHSVT